MKRILIVLGTVLLFALLVVPSTPASAATGGCTVSPSPAVTGTTLMAQCWGLIPNALANVYFVEPDGRTFASGEMFFVTSVPVTPRADGAGNVAFAIITRFPSVARAQLGGWKVVATNPGGPSAEGSFFLTGNPVGVSGGSLNITGVTTAGLGPYRNFTIVVSFAGTGFAPGEAVNGWFDYPSTCSGSAIYDWDTTAASTHIATNAVSGGSSWTADAAGNIGGIAVIMFPVPDPTPCTGTWQLTMRALGSGVGASASFVWAGRSVTPDGASWINVTVHGPTLVPLVTVTGGGFPPGAGINCWTTRPDGRTSPFPNNTGGDLGIWPSATAGAGGGIALTGFVEDPDLFFEPGEELSHSTEPGVWSMTCATPDHSSLAVTTFTLQSLTSDP